MNVIAAGVNAAASVTNTALKLHSDATIQKKTLYGIYQRYLSESLKNAREGLSLLWQLLESEASEDTQRCKAVLGKALEEMAKLSMADWCHEPWPTMMWRTLPSVFEVLKSLPRDTDPSLIDKAQEKFKMSSEICEMFSGFTKKNKFLCRVKTLALAFNVMSTLFYYREHPSIAQAICKGYLECMNRNGIAIISIHSLVWQFSHIHDDLSATKSWPLVRFEGKSVHPILEGSCMFPKMGTASSSYTFHMEQLEEIRDVAVNREGDIIIAGKTKVKAIDESGALLFGIKHKPSHSASLFENFSPVAAAVDAQNNVYVCSSAATVDSGIHDSQIHVFDKQGKQTHTFGKEYFDHQTRFCKGGFAVNTQGQMIVADTRKQCIHSLNLDGTKSVLCSEGVLANLEEPFSLCTTNDDKVVVVTKDLEDIYNIYVFDSKGKHQRHKEIYLQVESPVLTGMAYQPLTNHVILAVKGRRRAAYKHSLLFYDAKTLSCLHTIPLSNTFAGDIYISTVPSDFRIIMWVPGEGTINIKQFARFKTKFGRNILGNYRLILLH